MYALFRRNLAGKNGMHAYECQLWRWRRNIDARIEPIGMTQEDLKSWSPLAHEIRKTGVSIKLPQTVIAP